MPTVNFKRVVRFLFNIFFTFPNSSFFPVRPYSFCKFQLINHRVDALNLRCLGVTAVLLSRSTSKKNSLQKFKNQKNISSLCSSYFNGMKSRNLFLKKAVKRSYFPFPKV